MEGRGEGSGEGVPEVGEGRGGGGGGGEGEEGSSGDQQHGTEEGEERGGRGGAGGGGGGGGGGGRGGGGGGGGGGRGGGESWRRPGGRGRGGEGGGTAEARGEGRRDPHLRGVRRRRRRPGLRARRGALDRWWRARVPARPAARGPGRAPTSPPRVARSSPCCSAASRRPPAARPCSTVASAPAGPEPPDSLVLDTSTLRPRRFTLEACSRTASTRRIQGFAPPSRFARRRPSASPAGNPQWQPQELRRRNWLGSGWSPAGAPRRRSGPAAGRRWAPIWSVCCEAQVSRGLNRSAQGKSSKTPRAMPCGGTIPRLCRPASPRWSSGCCPRTVPWVDRAGRATCGSPARPSPRSTLRSRSGRGRRAMPALRARIGSPRCVRSVVELPT